ncbi:MAG: POTRA domain-containing protein [Fibrobacteraceae bacterium]
MFVVSAISFAQLLDVPDDFTKETTVRHVRAEGTVNMDERSVLNRVSVRDGQAFPPSVFAEKVQKSVSSLYETGYFDDVTAWVDYLNDGKVDLIFRVVELPALDTVLLEGYDEISEDDLRLKLSLVKGQVYSKSALERDRQNLLSYYRSEGYLLAEVGFREIPVSEHENSITFIIREGPKVQVDSIVIKGNDHVPATEITDRMVTKRTHWWGDGEFKEAIFEADRDTVLDAVRHFGYLDAELKEYRAEYLPDSTCNFYLGRVVPKDKKLDLLYAQLNVAISDTANIMNKLAGRTVEKSLHYYREHRRTFGPKAQAVPVPKVADEETAVGILNGIITYEELRKAWIKHLPKKYWKNSKANELYKKRNRNRYEEKLLTRYTLEETFSALTPYDSVITSSYVRIYITINEGRRYYAGSVHFSGNEVLSDKELSSTVQLDSGEVFDYYAYEATKKGIIDAYREDGYLFAQYDETRNFENDSVVNLDYHLREGLPAQIHRVNIMGNTKTKDKVIRREVRLFPGDTYRQSLLERSFREIMQLNYFDMVYPDIQVVGDQQVDLNFKVQEKEAGTGQFSAGLAYSQSDGLTGTLGVSIPNCCMGDGQNASFNIEYGEDKKSYSVSFSDPWFMDYPLTLGASLSYTWWNEDDDPDITRYGGSVYVGKRLTWPDDYFYGQVGYSWLMNKQGDNVDGSLVRYTGIESALNFKLIRDDKNLPQFPTEGSRYVLSVEWADNLLFSDFDFVKTDLTVKWWFPLFRDKLALALTNEYGVIIGDPIQYRTLYQMGGVLGYDGMMRGYSSGSIGYRRLGRSFQYFGAELQWGIVPNTFYLLPLFFDAGNVFGKRYDPDEKVSRSQPNPLTEWDPSSLKRDFGFGFRVVVPMLGIIGFDFAWPLDPGESYSGLQKTSVGSMEFNFVIGQGF